MKIRLFVLLLIAQLCLTLQAQEYRVSGQVKDKSTQETLPGVTIRVKDTNQATVSDIDGHFSITVKGKANVVSELEFSMVGYKVQSVKVQRSTNNLNVELASDFMNLDEVVVIGYGSVKKADLTGAVSVVDADAMKKMTTTSVSQALEGQVTGVTVKSTGAPGETGNIYIRGISSLYSNTSPLFVIDGLPTSDTRDFNPEDIESIQVLKDASAASIYGSRAANGVIIITTKKGKKGKPVFDFSAKYGIQNASKKFDLMGSQEWTAFQTQKFNNTYPGQDITQYMPTVDPTVNTDWNDQIFQTGTSQEYNLTASGGTDYTTYLISGNYLKQKGIVKGPDFERISTRINGSIHYGRLKIDEQALLSTSLSHDQTGSPLTDILRLPPIMPVYDADGNYALGGSVGAPGTNGAITNGTNPVAHRNLETARNRSYRIQGTANGEFEFTKWLKYQLNLGLEFNTNIWNENTAEGKWYSNQTPQSKYQENRNHYLMTIIENLLVFDKQFGKHSVNAIAGYTEQRTRASSIGGTVDDIFKDNSNKYYWSLRNGSNVEGVQEDITPTALRSFLGRVIYNYDNRYYLTASIRRDGSGRFAKGHKYGNFPSISAAWKISEEKFFQPIRNIVNTFKLNASYGVLGNEAIGDFKYAQYLNSFIPYVYGGNNVQFGVMPTVMVDQSLQWEEKKSWNIGIDAGFFDNALTLEANYFVNRSDKLLAQVPIPYYIGSWGTIFDNSTEIWRNAGNIENRGFELGIGFKSYKHPFKYDMKLNLSTISNKVKSLGGDNAPVYDNTQTTKTEVGRSLGEIFVVKTDGLYQESDINPETGIIDDMVFGNHPKPGDQKYQDLYHRDADGNLVKGPELDKDGKAIINIDDDDRTYVGSPWPDLDFSYNFNASYKDFDLSLYFIGSVGKTVYNSTKYWLNNVGDNGNYAAGIVPWSEDNPTASIPKAYDKAPLRASDRMVEKDSYLRLKSLQIGYNIPSRFLQTIGLTKCRIYFNAENLFTITGYDGLDPDFPGMGVFNMGVDGNAYPTVRTFGGGIQLSF